MPKKIDKSDDKKPAFSKLKYHFGLSLVAFPSSDQSLTIKQNSDASRFFYNYLVALGRDRWTNIRLWMSLKKNIPYENSEWFDARIREVEARLVEIHELMYKPKAIKDRFKWFAKNKRLDSLMPYVAKNNYQAGWNLYHKVPSAGLPTFHKKSYEQSYQTMWVNNNIRILDRKHVQLPKLGKIRVTRVPDWLMKRRDVKIGTVTVKVDAAGRITISFQLGSDAPFKKVFSKTDKVVGIDLNLENFATESNGNVIDNPRFYKQQLKKLQAAQRKLNKRERHAKKEHRPLRNSKNYQKQRIKVAVIHRHIKNQRKNFLHNYTTTLIKNHDLVVAEELRSKNMKKNHAISQSIQDVGWRMALSQLEYKAELYGKQFRAVDPRLTTQTCHACGFVMGRKGTKKLTLRDREWTCPACHIHHIRDHNAALNILAKAQ
jgi:putative transposase